MKLNWYLLIGRTRIPVTIDYHTKDRYFITLDKDCDRGDRGERLYVARKELIYDHDLISERQPDPEPITPAPEQLALF